MHQHPDGSCRTDRSTGICNSMALAEAGLELEELEAMAGPDG